VKSTTSSSRTERGEARYRPLASPNASLMVGECGGTPPNCMLLRRSNITDTSLSCRSLNWPGSAGSTSPVKARSAHPSSRSHAGLSRPAPTSGYSSRSPDPHGTLVAGCSRAARRLDEISLRRGQRGPSRLRPRSRSRMTATCRAGATAAPLRGLTRGGGSSLRNSGCGVACRCGATKNMVACPSAALTVIPGACLDVVVVHCNIPFNKLEL
jgi:hypothetical protein